MGQFCVNGFVSNLQIIEGDKVVCFLCVKNSTYTKDGITPIYCPFVGEYDGYGKLRNIEFSYSTNKFCELLEIYNLTKFIDIINHQERYINSGEEDIFNKFASKVKSIYKEFEEGDFRFAFEHYDIYKTILGNRLKGAIWSYNKCVENIDSFNKWYNDQCNIGNIDRWNDILDNKFNYINNIGGTNPFNGRMNINPNMDQGYFSRWSDYFNGDYLMLIFRNNPTLWLDESIKDDYIETMAFYWSIFNMGLPFRKSHWGCSENENKLYRKLMKKYSEVLRNQYKRLKIYDY